MPRSRPARARLAGAVLLAALAAALLVACGGARVPDEPGTPEHELTGITNWLNSDPLTISEELDQHHVVLIDFWTYSCINCIRTLPYVREWYDRYADYGLVVIGVHSPEFDFEHDADNVVAAAERLGVTWPIAQDNDFATWQAFENRFWPAKYLFGVDGSIRYSHFGEGSYVETESAIRLALEAAGHDLRDVPFGSDEPRQDPGARDQTRELYGGYEFVYQPIGLYAAQDAYYEGPDMEVLYEDIDTTQTERDNDVWYLHGLWRNERQAIVHARTTANLEDYIALRFRARTVNVVLSPPPGEPFDVVVELDGRALRPDEAGADVAFDDAGRSLVTVNEPRAYTVVEMPEWGEHELKLRSNSDAFAVFAFTFGSYLEGA